MTTRCWKHYHPDYPLVCNFKSFGLLAEPAPKYSHDCPYCNGQGYLPLMFGRSDSDCGLCQGTGINPDFIQWDKERLF